MKTGKIRMTGEGIANLKAKDIMKPFYTYV